MVLREVGVNKEGHASIDRLGDGLLGVRRRASDGLGAGWAARRPGDRRGVGDRRRAASIRGSSGSTTTRATPQPCSRSKATARSSGLTGSRRPTSTGKTSPSTTRGTSTSATSATTASACRSGSIHRLDEPDPTIKPADDKPLKPTASSFYGFPLDGRFDAEGLFIDRGKAFVVSKRRDGREAEVFAIRLDPPAPLLRPTLPERVASLPGLRRAGDRGRPLARRPAPGRRLDQGREGLSSRLGRRLDPDRDRPLRGDARRGDLLGRARPDPRQRGPVGLPDRRGDLARGGEGETLDEADRRGGGRRRGDRPFDRLVPGPRGGQGDGPRPGRAWARGRRGRARG